MNVTVLAPVLLRPSRVRSLIDSVRAAAPPMPPLALLFLVSPNDAEEQRAVEDALQDAYTAAWVHALVVPWDHGPGDYARKINHGADWARERGADWLLLGADDLRFHRGWLEAALAAHEETGACVVGTNDLGNSRVTAGLHSTHPLVHTDYLECGTIDEPGKLLHEGYHHNFCDTELVETAKRRGTWAFARDSRVEHLHHLWGKAPNDQVYEVGGRTFPQDQVVHTRRRPLWETP